MTSVRRVDQLDDGGALAVKVQRRKHLLYNMADANGDLDNFDWQKG